MPLEELVLQPRIGEGRVVDLEERPESEQYLERWDVSDCLRLGLSAEQVLEPEAGELIVPEATRLRQLYMKGRPFGKERLLITGCPR